jgi:hypothetical protein
MQIARWLPALAFSAALSLGAAQAALTQDSFLLRNTGDLIDLCTATSTDPLYTAASNFCHGFAVGVYRVLDEEESARRTRRIFCMPNPPPTRTEGLASFVQWAKANPNDMADPPADGIAKFLNQQFPCPRGR